MRGALWRSTVIIVSHVCPFPLTHGNRRRILSLLQWLRQKGFRTILVLQPTDVDHPRHLLRLKNVVDELVVVSADDFGHAARRYLVTQARRAAAAVLPAPIHSRLRGWLRRAHSHDPMSPTAAMPPLADMDGLCWRQTCHAVTRQVRRSKPAVVISEYAFFSRCFEDMPADILKIIDTYECFTRPSGHGESPERQETIGFSAESEKQALSRADLLIGIQRNDTAWLKALLPAKETLTVGYTCQYAAPRHVTPTKGTILCVGSKNPFNRHGLREFLSHAWPRILSTYPEARLWVAGSVAEGLSSAFPRMELLGYLTDEELAMKYQDARVVINPQVSGTGLKIKSVEALSAGCAVVMNQAGADGFEEGAGHAFCLAADWEDFVRCVVEILTDDDRRRQLQNGARSFAEHMFSPTTTFSELEQALQRHLGTSPREEVRE